MYFYVTRSTYLYCAVQLSFLRHISLRSFLDRHHNSHTLQQVYNKSLLVSVLSRTPLSRSVFLKVFDAAWVSSQAEGKQIQLGEGLWIFSCEQFSLESFLLWSVVLWLVIGIGIRLQNNGFLTWRLCEFSFFNVLVTA